MNITIQCECGNTDLLLTGKVSRQDRMQARLNKENGKPIYIWSEGIGKVMVKCLACNVELEL